jgi:ribosome biogenesis GTPase
MKKIPQGIEELGFEERFLDSFKPEYLNRFNIARVMAVHKDSFTINNGANDVIAEMAGKMLLSAASPLEYPAVGDWVLVTFHDANTFCIIHQLLPRISLLKRKTPGKKIDFQLIAANIDIAFIVQSLDTDFNLRRLERYLAMVEDSHIKPVVLLSKSDLLEAKDVADRVAEIYNVMPSLQVQPFSNKNEAGLKNVEDLLTPRQTYCLLGSSGVGKTTLLNNLIGKSQFQTKTVREKDGKGRHATTYRQLIKLAGGAMLIDTPGMRELGNFSVATGIDETFSEILELAEQCRFNDCSHVTEKGCAVLMAVENGQLPEERYLNYIKMQKESLHYEMSYLEKRKKDKEFGKYVKAVMKHKKNKR